MRRDPLERHRRSRVKFIMEEFLSKKTRETDFTDDRVRESTWSLRVHSKRKQNEDQE